MVELTPFGDRELQANQLLSPSRAWLLALSSRAALLLAAAACSVAASAAPATDPHVATAVRLVNRLDLANTGYAHGAGSVTWDGSVAAHTDCSGFIDQLLMHDDGLTAEAFMRWLGTRRPTAARYHDAIAESRGFEPVASIGELRTGDFIAIKYLAQREDTGRIMLAIGPAERMSAVPPLVDGTTQWAVPVIDSARSGHGPTDTRHRQGPGGRDRDGLGRGVFRIYADAAGAVTGFAWSTSKASRYVEPGSEHLVMGRLATLPSAETER